VDEVARQDLANNPALTVPDPELELPSAGEVLGYDTIQFDGPDLQKVRFVRSVTPPKFDRNALDSTLVVRASTAATRSQSREQRSQGGRVRSGSSRGDPDPEPEPEDDELDELTPLQLVNRLIGDVFRLADEALSPREYAVWLSILTSRVARDNARVAERGEL
jgi:hypothetical protein